MAKSDLTLNIGSKYNGEGLKKLKQDLNSAGAQAKNASKSLGAISQALGGLGGMAGKATGIVGNLLQSLTAFGPVGLVIGGVTAAFGVLSTAIATSKERMKEFAKTMDDSVGGALNRISTAITSVTTKIGKMQSQIGSMAKVQSIGSSYDIQSLETERDTTLVGTKDPVERAKIELDYAKKIADAKAKGAEDAVQSLKQQVDLQKKAVDLAKQAVEEEKRKKLAGMKAQMLAIAGSDRGLDEKKAAVAAWEKGKAAVEAIDPTKDKSVISAQEKLKQMEIQLLEAESKSALETQKKKLSVLQAQQKYDDEVAKKEKSAKDFKLFLLEQSQKMEKTIAERNSKDAKIIAENENKTKKEVADKNAKDLQQKNKNIQDSIKDVTTKIQTKNREIENWLNKFNNGGSGGGFASSIGDSKNATVDILDDQGKIIASRSKKDQRAFEAAQKDVERLSKIKGLSKSQQERLDKKRAWVDANDPAKIAEMQKEKEKLEKEKELKEEKMRMNIETITKIMKDGVTI